MRRFLHLLACCTLLLCLLASPASYTVLAQEPTPVPGAVYSGFLSLDVLLLDNPDPSQLDVGLYYSLYDTPLEMTWMDDGSLQGRKVITSTSELEDVTVLAVFTGQADYKANSISFTKTTTTVRKLGDQGDSTYKVTISASGAFSDPQNAAGTANVSVACTSGGEVRCINAESFTLNGATTFTVYFYPLAVLDPIIFLPGIAGTELTNRAEPVWPFSLMGDRESLALQGDGKTPVDSSDDIGPRDILRSGAADVYGGFDGFLKRQGYIEDQNYFVFPYDWRLDNAGHLAALDVVVDQAMAKNEGFPVTLIAHSMGGLIANAYVYSSAERAGKVAKIITLATPYYGAPKAFYALLNGYQFGNPTVGQEMMKHLAQNMPGAYQLLPRAPFVVDQATNTMAPLAETWAVRYHNLQYDEQCSCYVPLLENTLVPNQSLIQQANDFHAMLGSLNAPQPLPVGVELYTIIGYGIKTLGYYTLEDVDPNLYTKYLDWFGNRQVKLKPGFTDGDSTVPLWALENKAATKAYYIEHSATNSAAHGAITSNTIAQEIVGQLLADEEPSAYYERYYLPGSEGLPDVEGGVKSYLIGLGYTMDFTLHSDAHLAITDGSGRSLGFNAEGGIDESLPGTFLSIDGIEYASVTAPAQPFKVTVTGYQEGKFSLDVAVTNAGQRTSYTYAEVPVRAGTRAEFSLDPAADPAQPPQMALSDPGGGSSSAAAVNVQQAALDESELAAILESNLGSQENGKTPALSTPLALSTSPTLSTPPALSTLPAAAQPWLLYAAAACLGLLCLGSIVLVIVTVMLRRKKAAVLPASPDYPPTNNPPTNYPPVASRPRISHPAPMPSTPPDRRAETPVPHTQPAPRDPLYSGSRPSQTPARPQMPPWQGGTPAAAPGGYISPGVTYHLQISVPGLRAWSMPLPPGGLTIGRAGNNQLVLPDRQVSHHHARLALRNGVWWIFDLGSSNGAYVNNLRVQQQAVRPGDVIRLGRTHLVIK